MDLRSNATIEHKEAEAPAERELADRKRERARMARSEGRIKQREEEAMDRKADKADEHGEQLRRDRATVLERVQGYHRHIDGCTAEMTDCERRIDEYRGRVRNQQDLIRTRREEVVTLRQEAVLCRAEADSYAILGTRERELGNRSSALLEQTELKHREAMRRETEADDLEKMSFDGERNIYWLCEQLLINGRQRGDVQRGGEEGSRDGSEPGEVQERERELSDSCKRDEG